MKNDIAANQEAESTLEKRVYTVEEIQKILSIGRNAAYVLVRSGAFHTVKIGSQYRVSKKQFDKWLEERMEF